MLDGNDLQPTQAKDTVPPCPLTCGHVNGVGGGTVVCSDELPPIACADAKRQRTLANSCGTV